MLWEGGDSAGGVCIAVPSKKKKFWVGRGAEGVDAGCGGGGAGFLRRGCEGGGYGGKVR